MSESSIDLKAFASNFNEPRVLQTFSRLDANKDEKVTGQELKGLDQNRSGIIGHHDMLVIYKKAGGQALSYEDYGAMMDYLLTYHRDMLEKQFSAYRIPPPAVSDVQGKTKHVLLEQLRILKAHLSENGSAVNYPSPLQLGTEGVGIDLRSTYYAWAQPFAHFGADYKLANEMLADAWNAFVQEHDTSKKIDNREFLKFIEKQVSQYSSQERSDAEWIEIRRSSRKA